MAEKALTLESLQSDISVALWEEAGWLPCDLSVEVPVHGLSVRDLLELSAGTLVATQWKSGQDTPLRVNGRQVGWVEFEQMGEALGVRVTELF